jgi:hypothetical protein
VRPISEILRIFYRNFVLETFSSMGFIDRLRDYKKKLRFFVKKYVHMKFCFISFKCEQLLNLL